MASASIPACLYSQIPVFHPPHLEGDPAFATEILPGPPSIESLQQDAKKSESKPPLPPKNYLPLSDPGTTYSGLAGGMAALVNASPDGKRKRARLARSQSNRAQGLSAGARALPGYLPESAGSALDTDPGHVPSSDLMDEKEDERSVSPSRSASCPPDSADLAEVDAPITPTNGSKRDKRSEKDGLSKFKEEPAAQYAADTHRGPAANEDYCSSCSAIGALVYCDGCPRAFHLWCLDPPIDPADFPDEERWFCSVCQPSKTAKTQSHSFLSPLLRQLNATVPAEFKLPEHLRTFFRDVGTGMSGTYVDTSSKKQRFGRHGVAEDRDPHRLKDNRNGTVMCYHCGKSALPIDSTKGTSRDPGPSSQTNVTPWKNIVSCDFCPLHWHIDCLDPPLTSLPSSTQKWKCPNHASNNIPKFRTPRTLPPPVDVTETRQRNNGNIDVINTELPLRPHDDMNVEEILINGRKYRVPERIIILDFWSALRKQTDPRGEGGALSPLTSLSSLNDSDGISDISMSRAVSEVGTSEAAAMLHEFKSNPRKRAASSVSDDHSTFQSLLPPLARDDDFDAKFDNLAAHQSRSRVFRDTGRNKSNTSTFDLSTMERKSAVLRRDELPGSNSVRPPATHHDMNGTGINSYASPDKKPSGSPLKIRIPGRLLKRPVPVSSRRSVESSASSVASSTRRSLRNQPTKLLEPT